MKTKNITVITKIKDKYENKKNKDKRQKKEQKVK